MNRYGHKAAKDAVAGGVGQDGLANRSRGAAGLFIKVLPTTVYATPAAHVAGLAAVAQDRLSRADRDAQRLERSASSAQAQTASPLFNALLCRAKASKKGGIERILDAIFRAARADGLIDEDVESSVDSTGMESQHVSRHFLKRSGRVKRYRRWTKLTIACEHSTHLIAAGDVRAGPSNDSPTFEPILRSAAKRLRIRRVLADGGYDAEGNHLLCRQLGIRSSVIPVNLRGGRSEAVSGKHRRQMLNRFPHRKYKNRWHVESVFSRLKRNLGSALTARNAASRERECYCRVITHDLSILRPLY